DADPRRRQVIGRTSVGNCDLRLRDTSHSCPSSPLHSGAEPKTPQLPPVGLKAQVDWLSDKIGQTVWPAPCHRVAHGVAGEGVAVLGGKPGNRLAVLVEDGDTD